MTHSTAAAALSLTLPVRAAPPTPEETLGSVRADVEEIRERSHR